MIEFGGEHGVENNTRLLLLKARSGVWLDGDAGRVGPLRQRFEEFPSKGAPKVQHAGVTAENIEGLFEQLGLPREFDLLTIDIDSNDYWVWKAVMRFSLMAVVVEYKATFGPGCEYVMANRPDYVWDRRRGQAGAGLKAGERLGARSSTSVSRISSAPWVGPIRMAHSRGTGTSTTRSISYYGRNPPTKIPEPASLVLLGFGLVGLSGVAWLQ